MIGGQSAPFQGLFPILEEEGDFLYISSQREQNVGKS